MASATAYWLTTPNKKDNLTNGWTSKTLFNFHLVTDETTIQVDNDVFIQILTQGYNYKGTRRLPTNYFAANSLNDCRSFKVTMFFEKVLDGGYINIYCGLVDIDNNEPYHVKPDFNGNISSDYAITLCKLEYYQTVYYNEYGDLTMQITGNIVYAAKSAGDTTIVVPFNDLKILQYGTGVSYDFSIINTSNSVIYIKSLTIEELG